MPTNARKARSEKPSARAVSVAKVFKNGNSQAVRLPAAFRLNKATIFVRRDPANGDIILSERPQRRSLEEIFADFDAVGGAESLLENRDRTFPQDRELF